MTEEKARVDSTLEEVALKDLREHPRNYRSHPEDQLEHLVSRIEKYGVYRNIVIARDGTILAGHGVARAARKVGRETIQVRRLDLDPDDSRALEVLTGDNEVQRLGEIDDRALSEILKEINEREGELLGTGYDEQMLQNLVYITRPASEIADHNEAAHWVGMPDYEPEEEPFKIIINFEDEETRQEFADKHGLRFIKAGEGSKTWTTKWPFDGREDPASLIFDDELEPE